MDWMMGLLGGLMIGCAGALYLLVNGRVMGASGIMGGVIDGSGRTVERIAFIAGLIMVPAFVAWMTGWGQTHATSSVGLLVAAGLLVGLGTRIGNGCTSGHGVCGISRLSLRGIVSTVIYIGAGAVTVAALRALGGM
ncbi:YeeE/YedE family protein [Harenicola maris]